jgi:hypothetical protein
MSGTPPHIPFLRFFFAIDWPLEEKTFCKHPLLGKGRSLAPVVEMAVDGLHWEGRGRIG